MSAETLPARRFGGSFGAKPWRFNAADYVARPGRPLEGAPVMAHWDAALAPEMARHGCALDEEAVASVLLDELASASTEKSS